MLAYLLVRLVIALIAFYEIGWRIQVLFWWGLMLWLIGLGLFRLMQVCLRAAKRA